MTAFDDAWALLVEPVAVDDAWLADCEAAPEEAGAGVLVSEFDWLSAAIFHWNRAFLLLKVLIAADYLIS